MTVIKKGCMIFFHGKHITPAYLEEDKQKMLINEGLIADKYIIKQQNDVQNIPHVPLSDTTNISQSYKPELEKMEVDEKTVIREELKELGIKAGGRTSIEKLREMLKEAKGE